MAYSTSCMRPTPYSTLELPQHPTLLCIAMVLQQRNESLNPGPRPSGIWGPKWASHHVKQNMNTLREIVMVMDSHPPVDLDSDYAFPCKSVVTRS
jgi:hypothetical protein